MFIRFETNKGLKFPKYNPRKGFLYVMSILKYISQQGENNYCVWNIILYKLLSSHIGTVQEVEKAEFRPIATSTSHNN